MFILAHQKVTFCFANSNIIADVILEIVTIEAWNIETTFEFMKVGIISLKRKAFLIRFDDWKMTFQFFLYVLKMLISCFLLWNEIISKISKQIKISFSALARSDVLPVINDLIFWYISQWKKVERDFSAILTLNIKIHCETYCNQHIYWMLAIQSVNEAFLVI